MKQIKCQVCEEEISKYKCPKCALQYCSVGCYKNHIDEHCVPTPIISEPNPTINNDGQSEENAVVGRVFWEDEDEARTRDTVTGDRLQRLGECKKLRHQLENVHLRDIMTGLTGADNPRLAMDAAMQEPIFTEFVDQCMYAVEDKISENTPPWS